MSIELDLQIASTAENLPSEAEFLAWVTCALKQYKKPFELTIRIVDVEESQQLNAQYRQQDKPTNVLSFPFEVPEEVDLNLIGDLVICAGIVNKEAIEQGKTDKAHWAHMVIHGCLHLLGFDHIDDNDAKEMEALEISLLSQLNINDPYAIYTT
ncbi:rRNA maturation RNase YbeY [Thalassotalea piscium]|uniref:Endoribonuclease YbeY n=1 Tax=Thalassotalea piscium TaxID=1230533 RepID=A0A7X0NIM2_9GAMM|nr:rRNA maturation RNase YbeY [Thalassotalea piscium]MBB6544149.1 putative rRNA maturation factor [Thalassotalea piscium]